MDRKAVINEALYQFIKRVRLERSAWRLKVDKARSITEIGADCGYSSSNFATAFKKHMNLSPADFRKSSEQLVEQSSFSNGLSLDDLVDYENRITIEQLDDPTITEEEKCLYELCQTVSPDDPAVRENKNLLTHTFPGGRMAIWKSTSVFQSKMNKSPAFPHNNSKAF